jgi:hypothetical protein
MASALSLDDVLVVSPDQVAADLGGEVVILGMKEGAYFSVSAVAERIWALLQSPHRLADIVTTLTSEYDVAADQCAREVLAFADDLCARGLVVRHVEASP